MIEPMTEKSVFIAVFRHFSTYFLLICRKKQQTLFFPIHENYNLIYNRGEKWALATFIGVS